MDSTPEAPKVIRVALVEDDDEIRTALALLVERTPGLEGAGAYPTFDLAWTEILRSRPDVVLLDIGLPGTSGLVGVARLRDALPETEVIMLTIREDDDAVFEALKAGATGYLLKTTPPHRILESIAESRSGGAPMSPQVARRVAESFRRAPTPALTPRESEILTLLCDGHSYKMIAADLFLSVETVHTHLKSVYRKLEVGSKSEAVAKAIRDRLV